MYQKEMGLDTEAFGKPTLVERLCCRLAVDANEHNPKISGEAGKQMKEEKFYSRCSPAEISSWSMSKTKTRLDAEN